MNNQGIRYNEVKEIAATLRCDGAINVAAKCAAKKAKNVEVSIPAGDHTSSGETENPNIMIGEITKYAGTTKIQRIG